MNIGVLGTGNVGQTLGAGCAQLGHSVMIGSRDANNENGRAWAAKTAGRASSGSFADAARFADVAIVATNWMGTENALRLAGPERLDGKVVIDATNPLDFSSGAPVLAVGHTDSGGERVQRWLPAARVVKAFNTVGFAHMFRPAFPGGPPDMFLCGADGGAKQTVIDLLTAFGWNAIDIGGIQGARLLEPLCLLWVTYGSRTNSWHHAFKLLHRE